MVKMLIIADDFTGALDTGIQFAKKGIITQVVIGSQTELRVSETARVLVVDLETRPMKAEDAYRAVYNLTKWAVRSTIPIIYKKTDSALRGNVGAELSAVVDASEENLYFIPAFPDIGRITLKGIHYIGDVPLEKSAFKEDPFEPVHSSYLPAILGEYAKNKVKCIGRMEGKETYIKEKKKIIIFDAGSNKDIEVRIKELKEERKLSFLAGCAGFAAFLPPVLGLEGVVYRKYEKKKGLYVACGSLNPITREQVMYAEQKGFLRISLTPRQKLDTEYYKTEEGKEFLEEVYRQCIFNPRIIVDTFDKREEETKKYAETMGIDQEEIRFSITKCHSMIVRYLIEKGVDYTIFMTGGDTLMGLMKMVENPEFIPVCELSQGVVLSRLKWRDKILQIVSKSGGFGSVNVMTEIADKLVECEGGNYEGSVHNRRKANGNT